MKFSLLIIILIAVLNGCSQNQSQGPVPTLANSSWLAEDIDDTGVTDKLQFTLAFGTDLTVSGISGCNRFTGQATVTSQDIEFGPLASTRMACPAANMNQEDRYLRVLNSAAAWSLDSGQDRLTLLDAAGRPILRFTRITDQN